MDKCPVLLVYWHQGPWYTSLSGRQLVHCYLLNASLLSPVPAQLDKLEQLLRWGCHLVAGRMSSALQSRRLSPSRNERVRSETFNLLKNNFYYYCFALHLPTITFKPSVLCSLLQIYRAKCLMPWNPGSWDVIKYKCLHIFQTLRNICCILIKCLLWKKCFYCSTNTFSCIGSQCNVPLQRRPPPLVSTRLPPVGLVRYKKKHSHFFRWKIILILKMIKIILWTL